VGLGWAERVSCGVVSGQRSARRLHSAACPSPSTRSESVCPSVASVCGVRAAGASLPRGGRAAHVCAGAQHNNVDVEHTGYGFTLASN